MFFLLFVALATASLAPLHQTEADIADHYVVVFKKETPVALFTSLLTDATTSGAQIQHVYKKALKGFSAKLDSASLLNMRKNSWVSYIEGDKMASIACTEQPSDSWGQTRISQAKINLDGEYAAPDSQGAGVVAYIIDTGVYVEHNDFQGRAKFGFKAEPGWSDTDRNGHGTHVGSTIAGRLYGVAKKAEVVGVKVLGDNGSGSWSGVIAGIDYTIVQHEAKGKPSVANLSLGGGKMIAVNEAINAAVAAGVVMNIAAGNSNADACNFSPASATDGITVGSTDIGSSGGNQVDIRSSFSNFGKCTHVFAPGSNIKGAWVGGPDRTNTIS